MQRKIIQSITPPTFQQMGDIAPGQVFGVPSQQGKHFLRVDNHMNAVCLEDGKPWSFDSGELMVLPANSTFTVTW